MIADIEYDILIKNKNNYIFVDTRCPREYNEATIPGAVNIPLFTDDEYSRIGTLYKNEGREASVLLGIDFVSKRLPVIYREFSALRNNHKKIAVFCARGGMRSSSIVSLLQSIGMAVVKISKGYKGYRNFINRSLPEMVGKFNFISLYGKTGSGKTYILNELKKLGCPVLDLEGCANHRGSLLGSIGLGPCNSQKMFESLVFESLYRINDTYVFTEGESKRIGKIIMPDYLYNKITQGRKFLIKAGLDRRIRNIREEYITAQADVNEIKAAVETMEPYIGKGQVREYVLAIERGEYDSVIVRLILDYYDNAYSKGNKDYEMDFVNNGEAGIAKKIMEYVEKNGDVS